MKNRFSRIRAGWFLIGQCLLLSPFAGGYAQSNDEVVAPSGHTLYNISAFASSSTGGLTPFWMTSNRHGIVPLKANNGYLQAQVFHYQPFGSKVSLRAGLDLIAVAPRNKNVILQQLFVDVAYDRLHLSVGSRARDADGYNTSLLDASLSSGDMTLSSNARPIPEINIYMPDFILVPWTNAWLQVRGNFAAGRAFDSDYLKSFVRTKQHYVRNVLWHHKSLYLRIKDTNNGFPFSMTIGIRHTAQWGGVSTNPAAGTQPHSLKDFLRVIAGKSGGSDASLSDRINVLGNHFGSYDFQVGYAHPKASIYAYYQHFFDDASGMEFFNALDGLMGIRLDLHNGDTHLWPDKILIERLNTLNQSGPFHFISFDHNKYPGYGGGGDNYYNNGEYVTGASYFNRSVGSPLLISPEYNADGRLGFRHNRITAWHLGAEGRLTDDFSYRLLCAEAESLGTPYGPLLKKLRMLSAAAAVTYHCRNAWSFSVTVAADRGDLLGNHAGIGISVTKRGRLR
ncbi:MAG: capsule assembly Wzi family protein [Tannerella sp.]|jgi:hypothetical protein|nr:capsule assembly Wzi family protein [Tannerella sp.]